MAFSLILGIVVGVVMGITGTLQRCTNLSMQSIVPTLIGRQFAQRLSNVQIQRGFATLLILVALGLLARTAMAG